MIYHQIKKNIQNTFSDPAKLFWFYMAVNILPSFCLIFTEPFNLTGKLILLAFPAGLFLFLLSLLRNTGLMQLFLIPVLILHAFQLVLFYLFGEAVIAVDMFLNLATTNVSEASELLDNIWPAIVIVCVVYIPTIIIAAIACKHKLRISPLFRKKMLLTGVIFMIVSWGLTFVAQNKNTGEFSLHQDAYPANVIYNLGYAIHKWQRSESYPVTSKDFKFNAHKENQSGKRELYVLVIGEASRAGNWSLFGYDRETNPALKDTPGLVIYKDAITQSNTTHKSVPLILSGASAENYDVIYSQKSIVSAFKEAGFTTVFLSNQTPNRSFTDFFAGEADFHHNIRVSPGESLISSNYFDEALLPLLQHYVDSIPDNLFIVLHTYGSHFNYKERYPAEFSRFQPDNATDVKVKNKGQLINAYDNSVLYTDDFLHDVMTTIKKDSVCSALFYTADHGEDLLDDERNRFLHASPNPTFYQLHIPILMWFSENYQIDYPEKVESAVYNQAKPVATNAAFHTLLDMASINTKYLQPDLSLVSQAFKYVRRMYLSDHDKPIFFYNAGLKKPDKEMIEKYRLYHE